MNIHELPSPGEVVWMRANGLAKPVRATVRDVRPHEVLLKFDDETYHFAQTGHRALYLAAFDAALVRGVQ